MDTCTGQGTICEWERRMLVSSCFLPVLLNGVLEFQVFIPLYQQ